jgi:hypothetical protein
VVRAVGTPASAQLNEGLPGACFAWQRRQKQFITGLIRAGNVSALFAHKGAKDAINGEHIPVARRVMQAPGSPA